MSLTLPFRWPWQREPSPSPSVDVEAVARQAAQEAVAELQRALSVAPIQPIPDPHTKPPYAAYHFDNPYWYVTPQSPKRRPGSGVSTDTLRRIADSYDVARACIQHLKREVAAVPVEVVGRDSTRKRDQDPALDAAIIEADAFFGMEGGLGGAGRRRSHFEGEVIEDLCVIGAAAIYYAPTRGGRPYEALALDASTIRPRVDAYGWPGPGETAYEQWIYGVMVRAYTREELRYDGVYPLSYTPYFKSPLEWLLNTANAGMRADNWNLSWLTDGTTPSDTLALPENWTPDQIDQFAAFDRAQRQGDNRERQHTRWVPSGTKQVGNPSRKDQDFSEYELWLLRRTCAIFGVQPASIGFAGEQYKVSQEDSMESTSAFGVGVLLEFRKSLYDDLLTRLGFEDLECRNVISREEDSATRADRNTKLVAGAVKTPNEARKDEGLDPIQGGDTLFVSTTLQPLELALKPPEAPAPTGGAAGVKSADTPPAGRGDYAADLARWERKALGRLKAGKPAACAFESEAIPDELLLDVERGLKLCQDEAEVRSLFRTYRGLERAEKAAKSEGGSSGGIHWVTIDGHAVPITDKSVGPEHIRQATAKLGLGKHAFQALNAAHKADRVTTDAHLYHAIRHATALQAKGQSEKEAFAAAIQKHGGTPEIKTTKSGGIKVPGEAPLSFQATSDLSILHAAARSRDPEQIREAKEEVGPERVKEALAHARRLRDAGLLDQAVQKHRDWLEEEYQAESDRWKDEGHRETSKSARALVQEAASQARRLNFRDRATGRSYTYYELSPSLSEDELETIYQTLRTPARENTKSGAERMFPVPGHHHGEVKMWTLRELIVDEKKLPGNAVRLKRWEEAAEMERADGVWAWLEMLTD